jgi:uncharacterized protein (DUF1778 family)
MPTATKVARFNLRATPDQDAAIRAAAEATGRDVTDFILENAVVAAWRVLADRTYFGVSAEAWDAFTEILDRPATVKPRLRQLMSTPSVLEQRDVVATTR